MPGNKKMKNSGHPTVKKELDSDFIQTVLAVEEEAEQEMDKEEARKKAEARKKRKEKNIREMREAAENRVSYVRKPLAARSFLALGLILASIAFGAFGVYRGIVTRGQAELSAAAMVLCSFVLALSAVWYGCISFLEKEKNYVLARICIVLGLLVLIACGLLAVLGVRS